MIFLLKFIIEFSNTRPQDMWFYESPNKYVREFLICDYKYSGAKICASREKLYVWEKLDKVYNSMGPRVLDEHSF